MSHSFVIVFVQTAQSQDVLTTLFEMESNSLFTTHISASLNLWGLYFLRCTSPSETSRSSFIDMIYCLFHQSNISFMRTRIFLVSFLIITYPFLVISSVLRGPSGVKNNLNLLQIHEPRIQDLYHHHIILKTLVIHCKMLQRLSNFVKTQLIIKNNVDENTFTGNQVLLLVPVNSTSSSHVEEWIVAQP